MDDRLRASHADRDRAAGLLRAHFVAGRLTRDELDERLAATLSAATFGDLRRALADLPGTGPALLHDSRLERGYRRLLALYPARYRRVHEEELLAVLMTAAADGQDRPRLAEATDLIIGALRVRCQALRGAVPGWRGALAVIGAGTVLGVLAGIPFASVSPVYSAAANVRLAAPRSVNQDAQHTIASTLTTLSRNRLPSPTSYPVMARAAQMLGSRCVLRPQWHHCRSITGPHVSVYSLRSHVHISFLPGHEMVINAEATDGRGARGVLDAVAASYMYYLDSNRFYRAVLRSGKRHPARLLYLTSAAPRSRSTDVLETSGLGALFGALIGAGIGAAVLIPRRRRLRIA